MSTDDDMVALVGVGWLLGLILTLIRLFERVGWKVNVGKIDGMFCRPSRWW